MKNNNFDLVKFNNFLRKAKELSSYDYHTTQSKIDYKNKATNCYGFVSHLFPFLKEATHSRISVYKKVNDCIDIKIQREPTDYCFILCTNESGFYNHISVYVNGYVYDFTKKGIVVETLKEFSNKFIYYNFFTAIEKKTGIVLNNIEDFK